MRPELKAVQRNDGGSVQRRGRMSGLCVRVDDEEERRTREDKKRGSVRFSDRQMRVEASAEEREKWCC